MLTRNKMQSVMILWLTIVISSSAAAVEREFILRKTFSEALAKSNAVVVARTSGSLRAQDSEAEESLDMQFHVLESLKGNPTPNAQQPVARINRADSKSKLFLLKGYQDDDGVLSKWRVIQPLTGPCRTYLKRLADLKSSGAERLAFFEPYLTHVDPDVSADAHLEFWLASDEAFSAVSARMDRQTVTAWITAPDVTEYQQRLYLAMLARCGSKSDCDWLESKVVTGQQTRLLDAWISCYLALKGSAGLPLVNRLYLRNPDAEFRDTYAAMQALRFIGDRPNQVIPDEKINRSLRLILENSLMADLAVFDLTRRKDWESLDRVVKLFYECDENWVRLSAVRFVHYCPGPTATERLKEMSQVDAATVKRALRFVTPATSDSVRRPSRIRRPHGGQASKC